MQTGAEPFVRILLQKKGKPSAQKQANKSSCTDTFAEKEKTLCTEARRRAGGQAGMCTGTQEGRGAGEPMKSSGVALLKKK